MCAVTHRFGTTSKESCLRWSLGTTSGWRQVTPWTRLQLITGPHRDKQPSALTHTQNMQTQGLGIEPSTSLLWGSLIEAQKLRHGSSSHTLICEGRNVLKTCCGPPCVSCSQIWPLTPQTPLPSSSTSLPALVRRTSAEQVTAHSPTLPPSSQCPPACLPLSLPSPSLPSSSHPAAWEPYRPKICRRAAPDVECGTFW